MTALAKCKDCAAITLDTDEDARKHREWHRDYDSKLRNTRTAAVEARDALAGLRSEVKDLRDAWDDAPEPIEPDQFVVNDMRDDDELGLDGPEQASQYADEDLGDLDSEQDDDEEEDTPPVGLDPLTNYFNSPRA